MRLLVVDHGLEAARALGLRAAQWGYEVKVCLGAEEALEEVETFAPHAVVVETEGLGVEACSLAAALRRRAGPSPPRLLALVEPGHERAVYCSGEAGFDLHLSGILEARQLQEALSQLLSAYQAENSH